MSNSSSRSAFEAIPGKDALLEYQSKAYPAKTYVEKDGLVYKSLTATSNTFLTPQWELIADLREVRVPNISSRNALTGNTPTTGTTGIHIPILDNTNVLVLNASADPQVAANKFARYNYNKTNGTWLLLQIGTGATNSNVSNYQLLTNKPAVVSGVTVNAGTGLAGGGSVFGTSNAPYAAGGVISISHADTSSVANITNSGYAYVQKLSFDTFGHVTGTTSSTWVHPSGLTQTVINTGRTYIQSISVNNGHVVSLNSSPWVHPDTSSQADSVNSSNVFIQSIYLDGAGHVTGINTGVASGGGGGGSPLKYNGDSGGVLIMNSGSTLTISGGTNISTQRTGNAANPGLKINLNPAGTSTQLQYNNAGALGASANLTFTGGTTLVTNKISLTTLPVSGTTGNDFLMRDAASGAFKRLSISAIAGLPVNAIQYRTVGGFGGDQFWKFDPTNKAVTLGSRSAGGIGLFSLAVGQSLVVSGSSTFAQGNGSKAIGNYSNATNEFTTASGQSSHAEGQSTIAYGYVSHAEGVSSFAVGAVSHAQGAGTFAIGNGSHAGGGAAAGTTSAQYIRAGGLASFIHSTNTIAQTGGHGANAPYSAILGGYDHNIDSSNINAAIIGGNTIKLGIGGTYTDTTVVQNLGIWSTPPAGGSDDVLTWNSSTKKLGKVTQASLSGGGGGSPAGSDTEIQFNNVGAFGSSSNFTFVTGSSTLFAPNLNLSGNITLALPVSGSSSDQILTRNPGTGVVQRIAIGAIAALPLNAIQYRTVSGFGGDAGWLFDPATQSLTLGTRTGTTGQNSVSIGTNNSASFKSLVVGASNKVSGSFNLVAGSLHNVTSIGSNNFVFGQSNSVTGSSGQNFVGGNGNNIVGSTSMVFGNGNIVKGSGNSILLGRNLRSDSFGMLLGSDINVSGSTTYPAIGIGSFIKSVGSNNIAMGYGSNLTTGALISKGTKAINISSNTFYFTGYGIGSLGNTSSIFGGIAHGIDTSTIYSSIFGGAKNYIGGTANLGVIVGGGQSIIGGTTAAVNTLIVGGAANIISGTTSAGGSNQSIIGGGNNKIYGNANQSLIAGGNNNFMSGNTTNTHNYNAIFGGNNNAITGSSISASFILGGLTNKITGSTTIVNVGIIGGTTNKINGLNTNNSLILAGSSNTLAGNTSNSVIIGGQNNIINPSGVIQRAVIIGGQNITLTGSSQSDFVVVPNLMLWNQPSSTASNTQIVAWNPVTKKLNSTSQWLFDSVTNSITLGARAAGLVGTNSFALGTNNLAAGNQSVVMGSNNVVTGSTLASAMHFVFGDTNIVTSNIASLNTNFSIGRLNSVTGSSFNSGALGSNVIVGGANAIGIGSYIQVGNSKSIAIGSGDSAFFRRLISDGLGSIVVSNNALSAQVLGHGAHATYSSIFGGINHNIASGNTRATIIGGNGIKLTGTTYIDNTAVSNLAIFTTPSAGAIGTDDLLVWNSVDKKVKKVNTISTNHSNIAYVSVNGNDTTGLLNNITRPFATVGAANSAFSPLTLSATNRALIHIMPGSYNQQLQLVSFVDYYFADCIFNRTGNFITSSVNLDSKLFGTLTVNMTSGYFLLVNTNTSINLEINIIGSVNVTSGRVFEFSGSNGNRRLVFKADKLIIGTASLGSIFGSLDCANTVMEFNEIETTGATSIIQIAPTSISSPATTFIKAKKVINTDFTLNDISLTGTHRLNIDVDYMRESCFGYPNSTSTAIEKVSINVNDYVNTTRTVLAGGTPSNTSNAASYFEFSGRYVTTNAAVNTFNMFSTARVVFRNNPVIVSASAASVSGNAGSNILIYGNIYSNKPLATVVALVGGIVVDANIH